MLSAEGPCCRDLCCFPWYVLKDQLLNAAEAVSAASAWQMATGTLHPSPKGLLCSTIHRSFHCGQWSHIQITKSSPWVCEHMLYTLTSDFSILLLAVSVSSRVSTGPLVTVPPAPLHPPSSHCFLVTLPGFTLLQVGLLQACPALWEGEYSCRYKNGDFFWKGRTDKICTSEKTPSRKKRSSSRHRRQQSHDSSFHVAFAK